MELEKENFHLLPINPEFEDGKQTMKKNRANFTVSILGTGRFARTLGRRIVERSGNDVIFGSRQPESRDYIRQDFKNKAEVKILTIEQAIVEGTILVLALHSEHIEQTLSPYSHLIGGKTLVDVTNPTQQNATKSQTEQIRDCFPQCNVVKSFNTISAYSLEHNFYSGDQTVHIASDCQEAIDDVSNLCLSIGLKPAIYGNERSARQLERKQTRLFHQWKIPLVISIICFLLWSIYGIYRHHVVKGKDWSRLAMNTMNKVYGSTAITILSICYLAGNVASVVQVLNGTKSKPFIGWLRKWLVSRKQLGLLALWFTVAHAVLSIAHLSPTYFNKWYSFKTVTLQANLTYKIPIDTTMNWQGECTISIGTLALAFMAILGITSLPSVGGRLNWRQWRFIQSYLGNFCLVLSAVHVTIKAAPHWPKQPFVATLLGMSFISLLLPYLTLFLRCVLSLIGLVMGKRSETIPSNA